MMSTNLTRLVDRIHYIYEAIQENTEALSTEQLAEFVARYVPPAMRITKPQVDPV